MHCRILEMRAKQVVLIKNGCVLGCICDVVIDTTCGKIVSIVVCKRLKFFGLFGREEVCINWEDIEIIGKDAILVNCDYPTMKKPKHFRNFFNKPYENNVR